MGTDKDAQYIESLRNMQSSQAHWIEMRWQRNPNVQYARVVELHLWPDFCDLASHSRAFMRGPASLSTRSKSMGLSFTLEWPLPWPACLCIPRLSAKSRRTAIMSSLAAAGAVPPWPTSWQDIHSTSAFSTAKAALATCTTQGSYKSPVRSLCVPPQLPALLPYNRIIQAQEQAASMLPKRMAEKDEAHLRALFWLSQQCGEALQERWQTCSQDASEDAARILCLHITASGHNSDNSGMSAGLQHTEGYQMNCLMTAWQEGTFGMLITV